MSIRKFVPAAILLAVILLACASSASAQNIKAALAGRVTDDQGATLAGVTVTATDADRGVKRTVASDADGAYFIPGLEPGRYKITFSKDGFGEAVRENVALNLGEAIRENVALAVRRADEVVDVSAGSGFAIQSEEAKLSRTFSAEEMNDLPTASGGQGRNYYTQARTAPGVAASTQAHQPFAINGNRARSNNYLLDSVDNNDSSTGLVAGRGVTEQLVSQEAVAGLEVLTHNFKAEYGRNSGGIVSLVTKGGTKTFHGSVYEYHNNSALSARNFFEGAKASNRGNLAGFTLGGPIVKNRAFFFGQFETNRQRGSQRTTFQGLTDAERAQAVPAVQALVALYPRIPAGAARTFIVGLPRTNDQYTSLIRGDFNLTANQTLMARFNDTVSDLVTSGAGGILAASVGSRRRTISATAQHNFAITGALLNEFRLGYNRTEALDTPSDNSLLLGDPAVNGNIGRLSVTGLTTAGIPSFLNQSNFQNNVQLSNDLSWTRGDHRFKFGGSVRRVQVNGGSLDNAFRGQVSFLNVADFLAGRPANYTLNQGNPLIGLRRTEIHAYAQDDWSLRRNLNLNLGLRYEINTAPREAANRIPNQYLLNTDRNNVAPRFGLAWQFRPKTVLRAGYGVYFNVVEMTFLGLTRFNPPLVASFTAVRPTLPNLLGNAQQNVPSGLVIPNPATATPYAQHFNVTIERELARNATVSVAYVGTLSRKLSRTRRTNGGELLAQGLRPDPTVGVVNILETSANASYHALQVSWSQQFGSQLQLRGAYTWSKFIDDVSDIAGSNTGIAPTVLPIDERNLRLDRGISDFHIPQVLTLTGIWRVPFFKNNRWLGGWSLTGIGTLQSGRPFTILANTPNPTGTNNNRPNNPAGAFLRDGSSLTPIRLGTGFTAANLRPAAGQVGALGRNTERGDSFLDWSFSLAKDFTVTESLRVQVRGELFNAFNVTNFGAVDGTLGSATFGRATAAFDPRRAQLALRVTF